MSDEYGSSDGSDEEEILESRRLEGNESGQPMDHGSLERARTAWMTSVRHNRVMKQDRDKRSTFN